MKTPETSNPAAVLDVCDDFNSAVKYIKEVTAYDPLSFTYVFDPLSLTTSNEEGQALLTAFAGLGEKNIAALLHKVAKNMGAEVKNVQNGRGTHFTFPARHA
ncbi:MAG: hypothetical protein V4621_05180 [Pseudomonadota bacterium]